MLGLTILQIIGIWIAGGILGFPGMFNFIRIVFLDFGLSVHGRNVVFAFFLSLFCGPIGLGATTVVHIIGYPTFLLCELYAWLEKKPKIKRLLDKQVTN